MCVDPNDVSLKLTCFMFWNKTIRNHKKAPDFGALKVLAIAWYITTLFHDVTLFQFWGWMKTNTQQKQVVIHPMVERNIFKVSLSHWTKTNLLTMMTLPSSPLYIISGNPVSHVSRAIGNVYLKRTWAGNTNLYPHCILLDCQQRFSFFDLRTPHNRKVVQPTGLLSNE